MCRRRKTASPTLVFRQELLPEMEALVLKTGEPRLAVKFYQLTGQEAKVLEVNKREYESLLAEGRFWQAIRLARKEGLVGWKGAAEEQFKKEMEQRKWDQALDIARECELGPERVARAARAYYVSIMASPDHDRRPALELAQNELNDPYLVHRAVLETFDQTLRLEQFHDLEDLVRRFPDLIGSVRKELASLFSQARQEGR